MIKELIKELAYDKITLAQGLTRAKLIQSKIKSDGLKDWLKNELNGYSNPDDVPVYRTFTIKIVGDFIDDFGRQWNNTPLMLQEFGKSMGLNLYSHIEKGSIKSIEDMVLQCDSGSTIMLPLAQPLVQDLNNLYRKQDPSTHLMSAGRIVLPSQYTVILEQTKQRLLDTLLELDNLFPSLIDDYKVTQENKEKIQNIITNNIYGNNNPMNIAAGQNVNQTGNSISINQADEEKLKSLGVEQEQIEELKTIVAESSKDKETLRSKTMKWLGAVGASVGARGLYDNIPAITEFVQNLIEKSA